MLSSCNLAVQWQRLCVDAHTGYFASSCVRQGCWYTFSLCRHVSCVTMNHCDLCSLYYRVNECDGRLLWLPDVDLGRRCTMREDADLDVTNTH